MESLLLEALVKIFMRRYEEATEIKNTKLWNDVYKYIVLADERNKCIKYGMKICDLICVLQPYYTISNYHMMKVEKIDIIEYNKQYRINNTIALKAANLVKIYFEEDTYYMDEVLGDMNRLWGYQQNLLLKNNRFDDKSTTDLDYINKIRGNLNYVLKDIGEKIKQSADNVRAIVD